MKDSPLSRFKNPFRFTRLLYPEGRILDSFEKIQNYISNADDASLKFYKITNQARDLFAEAEPNPQKWSMGTFGITPAKSTIGFHYNDLECFDENALDKVMAHEIGHWVSRHSSNPARYWLAKTGRISGLLSTLTAPLAGAIWGWRAPEVHWTFGAFAGHLLNKHSLVFQYGISRLEERHADTFADKLIPEVGYSALVDAFSKHEGNKQPLKSKLESQMAITKFGALFSTHPSDYSRMKRSEKNCIKFIDYKKRHNIPSLINS